MNTLQELLKSDSFAEVVSDMLVKARGAKLSRANRRRWEDKFKKITSSGEKKFASVMEKYFNKMRDEVLSNMKKHPHKSFVAKQQFDFSGWLFDREDWNKELSQRGGEFIKEMFDEMGNEVFNGLEFVIGEELAASFNMSDESVQSFIEKYSYDFAEEINSTAVEDLREAMSQGIREGLGMDGIADLINSIFDSMSEYRAQLIARTETIRASNAAAEFAYQQSGVVTAKEWLVTDDDRTCELCMSMVGEVIDLGKSFFEEGDRLTVGEGDNEQSYLFDYGDVDYPPLHPNCRCCLIPVVDTSLLEEEKRIGLSVILKYGTDSSGNYGHEGRPGEVGGSGEGGEGQLNEKQKRAIASYKPVNKKIRGQATKNEQHLAKQLGGKQTADNAPFDVHIGQPPKHIIEVKTIVRGSNDKITMHKESLARKVSTAMKTGAKAHTVVFDDRNNKVYYREGVGSFRLSSCKDLGSKEEYGKNLEKYFKSRKELGLGMVFK